MVLRVGGGVQADKEDEIQNEWYVQFLALQELTIYYFFNSILKVHFLRIQIQMLVEVF